jgi:hypothetical protein
MFADVDADIYVMADGDLTYQPDAAPMMVDMLLADGLDMVVGTRRHEAKQAYRGGHVLGNRLFTGLLSGMFGRSFSDILSGYRVFSRRFVKSFPVVVTYFEQGNVPRLPTAILSMGLMMIAFLSLASGLVLDTVTRGRRELKRLAYLSHRAPHGIDRRAD